jgi:hypothetical protein
MLHPLPSLPRRTPCMPRCFEGFEPVEGALWLAAQDHPGYPGVYPGVYTYGGLSGVSGILSGVSVGV